MQSSRSCRSRITPRSHLLRWGAATFDALGPPNHYAARALPVTLQMMRFAKQVVRRRSVADGSMGHDILVAADAGKLAHSECPALMIDYLAPSLDTTISGISSALALFAMHPDQWQLLKTSRRCCRRRSTRCCATSHRCGRSHERRLKTP